MNPFDKKRPEAKAPGQQFKQPRGGAQPSKPVVTQTKSGVSAQAVKRPVAPPAYRPQSKPKAVQQKAAGPSQMRTPPVAPPVYRPRPVREVLQAKMSASPQSTNQSKPVPAAPPAYRPQAVPRVLQAKLASGQQSRAAQAPRQPLAPPVYRPGVVQAKPSVVGVRSSGVIQMLCELCKSLGEDHDHSPKKCPYLKGDDGEDAQPHDEVKKPAVVKPKFPPKKVEQFQDLGVNLAEAKVSPAAGNTVGSLANINKTNYPDAYLQTLINIGVASLTIGAGVTLTHGVGTPAETLEHKVSLAAGTIDQFVVIHYHPNVTLPKGALSGESLVHVKGTRGAKPHKYISSANLIALGLPVPKGHT